MTYQCRDAARDCLRSIDETTSGVEFEVVVVDNASDDGTADMIRAEFPDVRLIALDRNLGFAAGVNLAAESAEGEHLLLLNPDTVVHEGAVANLVAFARERPEARPLRGPDAQARRPRRPWLVLGSAVALEPLLLRDDAEHACSRTRASSTRSRSAAGSATPSARSASSPAASCSRRAPCGSGSAASTPASSCTARTPTWRIRAWAAGYRPAITPDSVVTHEVGVSSASRPDKLMLLMRGKVTLLRKHWRSPRRELGIRLLLAGVGVRALAPASLTGKNGGRPGAWREVWRARRSWLEGYPAAERPRLRAVA